MPNDYDPYDQFPTAPRLKEKFDQVKDTETNQGTPKVEQNQNIGYSQKTEAEIEFELKDAKQKLAQPKLEMHLRPKDVVVPIVHADTDNKERSKVKFLESLLENFRRDRENPQLDTESVEPKPNDDLDNEPNDEPDLNE